MKKILFILALPITGLAALPLKAFADLKPIPQEKIKAYEEAITMAIANQNITCVTASGSVASADSLDSVINGATVAALDSSGTQSELVFEEMAPDRSTDSLVKVTISADQKSIVLMDEDSYVKGDVNSGNLSSPVIEKGFVWTAGMNCTADDE